jgi:hypothetical protein
MGRITATLALANPSQPTLAPPQDPYDVEEG